MASGDGGAHGHGEAVRPWRELSPDERRTWAAAVAAQVSVDRAAQVITVTGPCPACHHDFIVRPSDRPLHEELSAGRNGLEELTSEDKGVPFDWRGRIRFLAVCYCDVEHPQRPAVVRHGCGASGWLIDEP